MKIREIIYEATPPAEPAAPAVNTQPAAAEPAPAEVAPPPEEIKAVQDLLGTIDPQKEQPQGLLNKLTSWMRAHPLLDKVTDIIPQTRLVKAIAAAVDAIEAGDNKTALASLAGGLTGSVGKVVGQANALVNVGSNLAQGNVKGAALAAGGNVAKVAKGVGAVTSLAQGDVAGAVGNVNKGAGNVATALQQKFAPTAPGTQVAGTPDELERIRQLAIPKT